MTTAHDNRGSIRAALIQSKIREDRAANLRQAIDALNAAADRQAQICCLPELFLSEYFCQTEDAQHFAQAEAIPGPTTEKLCELARRRRIVVIASLFEKRTAGIYHNTSIVIDADGELLGRYRKMHIPDDPHYYEKFYFTPGDLGFQSFKTRYAEIGVLVCWDQWFPEAARLTALLGAEIIFYPTAIGHFPHEKEKFGATQLESWQLIQRSHAVANGCFVAAVNRVGYEDAETHGIDFWGSSFVCDPHGHVVAAASDNSPEILYAELDTAALEATRNAWPFLRDRRIDAYDGLTSRFLGNS